MARLTPVLLHRKYENGALGSLTHVIALHGIAYSNEIAVVADGYQLRLVDLYTEPRLFVRYGHVADCSCLLTDKNRFPDDEREQMFHYPGDDPFLSELAAMCSTVKDIQLPTCGLDSGADIGAVKAVKSERRPLQVSGVLSSFEDAVKTYEFSWRIRTESERK